MDRDGEDLEATLERTQQAVQALELSLAPRRALELEAREVLVRLVKRRKHAQQRGVRTWETAQRGALRMLVLAVGCVVLGTGAWALDETLGGLSLAVSLVVLGLEGLR